MSKIIEENSFNMHKIVPTLVSGAFFSYLNVILSLIIGLVYIPWVISRIGADNYGVFALSISVINLFLMDLGFNSFIVKYVTKNEHKNSEHISDVITAILSLLLKFSLVILSLTLIFFLNIENVMVSLTYAEQENFKLLFIISTVFSLLNFNLNIINGVLIGIYKIVIVRAIDFVSKLIIVLLSFAYLINGKSMIVLILIYVMTPLILSGYKWRYVRRYCELKLDFTKNSKIIKKEALQFSFFVIIISASQSIILYITPIILARYSGSFDITVYSIALSLEGNIWSIANALNGIFLPFISKLSNDSNSTMKIFKIMLSVGKIQISLVGFVLLTLILIGKPFIHLWLGDGYDKVYYILMLITLPGFIIYTQDIGYSYLISINKIKIRAYDFMITALVSFLFCLLLVPQYGAVGAAISSLIGLITGHIVFINVYYAKVLKMDIIVFFRRVQFKYLFSVILPILLILVYQQIVQINSWFEFITAVILFLFFYSSSLWRNFLEDNEKKQIAKLLNKNKSIVN